MRNIAVALVAASTLILGAWAYSVVIANPMVLIQEVERNAPGFGPYGCRLEGGCLCISRFEHVVPHVSGPGRNDPKYRGWCSEFAKHDNRSFLPFWGFSRNPRFIIGGSDARPDEALFTGYSHTFFVFLWPPAALLAFAGVLFLVLSRGSGSRRHLKIAEVGDDQTVSRHPDKSNVLLAQNGSVAQSRIRCSVFAVMAVLLSLVCLVISAIVLIRERGSTGWQVLMPLYMGGLAPSAFGLVVAVATLIGEAVRRRSRGITLSLLAVALALVGVILSVIRLRQWGASM